MTEMAERTSQRQAATWWPSGGRRQLDITDSVAARQEMADRKGELEPRMPSEPLH